MIEQRTVDEAVAETAPAAIALAEAIRSDPELSGDEHRAAKRCVSLLEANGFSVESGIAGLPTACRAVRRAVAARVRVALLAEYDALPGIGHGCAHHLIAATSVGAALALARLTREDDDLEIQVIGTPSE